MSSGPYLPTRLPATLPRQPEVLQLSSGLAMGCQAGGLWPLGVQKRGGGQPPLLAAHLLHTPRRRNHLQVSG